MNSLGLSRIPDAMFHGIQFHEMKRVSVSKVKKLISSMPNKTSPQDSLQTNILKSCVDFLSPFIATMANLSFDTRVFPDCFKVAQVTPILKKQGLDACDPVNYRPISNLHTFVEIAGETFSCQTSATSSINRQNGSISICVSDAKQL